MLGILSLLVWALILIVTVKYVLILLRADNQGEGGVLALTQKYKQDGEKQQDDLIKLFPDTKINPASSCLPVLFQIPVFFALFFVLRDFEKEVFPKYPSSDLGWLWDLVPNITDKLSEHPLSAVVLLILYATSQTASTLLMSTTMDKMQRYLLLVLPLVFLFFVVNFPAGLMIYWVTTNLWTTGQGLVTRQLRPAPVQPEKRSSRTPPRGEAERPTPAAQPKPAAAATGQPRRVKRKKRRSKR